MEGIDQKEVNLFIENNPDAQEETEEDEKDEEAVKKRNIMSYDGSYESIQKETIEKVLDTRLSDMIELLEDKLNELIDEINQSRTEGKEQIMDGIDRIIKNLASCAAAVGICIASAGAATPFVAASAAPWLIGGGAAAGFFIGDKADKESAEREKTLLQNQQYKDAANELNQQIDANNQLKNQIQDITGKLNGTIPRKPNETDDYLNNQLNILTNNLKNGENRIDRLRNEVDKLRKSLGGNSNLMSLLGLDKLSFTDKAMIIAAIVLLI
ncbi:45328_t:CDS:2 [Gigaspora margarita]|uniref:45328_t:CDS:1 n=1 Tax=Gigaspora margarita TaxID=4874 RepID=A0ABN7V9T9_GIGMA|nr:45328_t:CDS:2 [Gigaspora margarita]